MELPDAELVEHIRAGDIASFETLVIRYERSVRSVALAYRLDRHAREDLAQEAFLAAYRGLPSLQQPDRFGPWLMQITRRICGKTRSQSDSVDTGVSICDLADSQSPVEIPQRQSLLESIERLPENERLVITMHYFDGHSTQSIAEATSRPLGTVTKQLSRAYQRLHRLILTEEETNYERT